ncbi:MAG: penicillin-binding protein 2, partial [Sphingomonadales bacterium]
METEGERYNLYSRRALILSGGASLLTVTLLGRLYYLGVRQGGQYKILAEENRVHMRLLSPTRGEILDRFGKKIATNRKDFRVFLIPEQTRNIEKTLFSLNKIIFLSEGQLRRIRRKIKKQKSFLPVTIAENLSWEHFSKINVESPQLGGIQSDDGETRLYPYGQESGHLVGYVGPVSSLDMTDDPVLQLPDFKIGKEGLEKRFEDNLRGAAGHSRVEVNAYGRVTRELNRQEGKKGESLVLTLDMALQQYTMKRLGEESASVVVMDIHNGDLLVNASTPSYNSNDFNLGISTENWEALLKDPRKPLINKTISGQYPPGSTFKMIVALAALEAGVVQLNDTVKCTGKYKFGDRNYHCWKKEGHGSVNLLLSLAQSCDIYYYKLAEKVGISKIAEMANFFGLGELHDIGLGGQASGLVPTPEWKIKTQRGKWQVGETLNVGIGQGAILATPLQLAVMISRLANGGKAVKPRLVHSVGGIVKPQAFIEDITLNRRNLAIVL